MAAIIKRLKEIEERKLQIRSLLESGETADLDALDTELRALDEEKAQIERRQAIAAGINAGTIPASSIPNPAAQTRSAETPEENVYATPEYRSGWLKNIRKLDLNDAEKRAITTAAASGKSLIPTVTVNKIIEKVHQYCPLLEKIDLLHVPSYVTIPAEGTTVDAAIHSEGAGLTPDADTYGNVTLGAFEITKLVSISKSVERMSMDAFESWLVKKTAKKIAVKIGSLSYYGTGVNEAQGINAIPWTESNSVTVAADASLTAANVKAAVGKLNGGYDDGAEWFMNKTEFMNSYHPLMNNSKDNIVTYDNGKYYVMGYLVNWDDRVLGHDAFLGNFDMGYAGNMAEEINVTSAFNVRENAYDFLGAAMFDGKVKAIEAFVKISKASA